MPSTPNFALLTTTLKLLPQATSSHVLKGYFANSPQEGQTFCFTRFGMQVV